MFNTYQISTFYLKLMSKIIYIIRCFLSNEVVCAIIDYKAWQFITYNDLKLVSFCLLCGVAVFVFVFLHHSCYYISYMCNGVGTSSLHPAQWRHHWLLVEVCGGRAEQWYYPFHPLLQHSSVVEEIPATNDVGSHFMKNRLGFCSCRARNFLSFLAGVLLKVVDCTTVLS